MPSDSARGAISPHPWALTSVVLQRSENGTAGSRLVTSTGTSSGSRLLRRMACWVFSEGPIAFSRQYFFGPQSQFEKMPGFPLKTYLLTMLDHEKAPW